MEAEVETAKLHGMVLRLCGPEDGTAILSYLNASSEIKLSELIMKMIAKGANRRAILSELRKIKLNESGIADAFSEAIASIAGGAEDEK